MAWYGMCCCFQSREALSTSSGLEGHERQRYLHETYYVYMRTITITMTITMARCLEGAEAAASEREDAMMRLRAVAEETAELKGKANYADSVRVCPLPHPLHLTALVTSIQFSVRAVPVVADDDTVCLPCVFVLARTDSHEELPQYS